MADARLMCVDWGTSSFRAWLVDAAGKVIAATEAPAGILTVAAGAFEAAFMSHAGAWLAAWPGLPVIASGMITSRNGWRETPYLPLPASADDLAAHLTRIPLATGHILHFVTGLTGTDPDGLPDVMRGEEVELVGHLAADAGGDGLFILPGTHSKWATAQGGTITAFRTYMTGEIFALLGQHSILGRLARPAPFRPEAFDRGVDVGLASPLSLLATAFSARTLALTGAIDGEDVSDYLSGLLIGSEIRSAATGSGRDISPVVIGRGDLADRYARALARGGWTARIAAPGMARAGQIVIARKAGLL